MKASVNILAMKSIGDLDWKEEWSEILGKIWFLNCFMHWLAIHTYIRFDLTTF